MKKHKNARKHRIISLEEDKEVLELIHMVTVRELIHDIVTMSKHMETERKERLNRLEEYLFPEEVVVAVFFVDSHHKDGPELHFVTESAMILVVNREKFKKDMNGLRGRSFVTAKFARPGQVVQLYDGGKAGRVPPEVYENARFNVHEGLNFL